MAERRAERAVPEEAPLPATHAGTVVTVGSFDGVHRGHRDVLAAVVRRARELGVPSLLVTFEPHPLRVVRPERAPQLLTLREEKAEALASTGLDYVVILPFTEALAALEAEEFVDRILRARFRMRHLVMGYDHGFGRGRSGDAERLQAIGTRRGFGVETVPPVLLDGERPIGSSAIRRAVAAGDLVDAERALGRPYAASGTVRHGEKRGRLLGFPTLNVELPSAEKLLPPTGVYAVRVRTPRGAHGGMMNLGPLPTFGDAEVSLEAHLFEAEGDFYGAPVRIDFVARLRDTRRFDGADALIAQLRLDAEQARAVLASGHRGVASVSVDSPALDP